MRRRPGYRCSLPTLRKLSHTEAHLDLSGGTVRRYPIGELGSRINVFLSEHFGSDREAAADECSRIAQRALGLGRLGGWAEDEKRALRAIAPVLAMIPDLRGWTDRDRHALARFIRAKGAASEAKAARLLRKHARFEGALWALLD